MKSLRHLNLRAALATGPKRGPELTALMQISQSTLSRSLRDVPDLVVLGQKRATLYALKRPLSNLGTELPLFRIDEKGKIRRIGEVLTLQPRGTGIHFQTGTAPRLHAGLPYYLWDHRPHGYLGRTFIAAHQDLGLPQRLEDWSDDQILESLARRGEAIGGDLIVGEESFRRWQEQSTQQPAIEEKERARHYDELAETALAGVIRGSSVGGDQPKFATLIRRQKVERHVLVKFSAPLSTPKGRRWGDLLLTEMHALQIIQELGGIEAAPTEIVEGKERIYLESTRFDRVGVAGRRGLISFAAVEHEFIGSASYWAASAVKLFRQKRITGAEMKAIQWLDAFGALIANTDRHYGNLSFFFDVEKQSISLAPAYDMLPMFYAPLEGESEATFRTWTPPAPNPDTVNVWPSALAAAVEFWDRVAKDDRVSKGFRAVCAQIRDRVH